MGSVGHNGGPSLRALSDRKRREVVTNILWSATLSASEKCIAIAIVMLPADKETETQLGYKDLSRLMSVKKRDSVFDAKKKLIDLGHIELTNVPGRSNFYRIVPESFPTLVSALPVPYRVMTPLPEMETTPVSQTGTALVPLAATPPVPQIDTRPPIVDGFDSRGSINILYNNNKTLRQTEYYAASEDSGWQTEIPGLNGATSIFVRDVAQWLSPYSPDFELARTQVQEAVHIFGPDAVRDGFVDLKAKIADGALAIPSIKQLYGFIRQAKANPAKVTSKGKGGAPDPFAGLSKQQREVAERAQLAVRQKPNA